MRGKGSGDGAGWDGNGGGPGESGEAMAVPYGFLRRESAWTVEVICPRPPLGGGREFRVLNLEHPDLERVVMDEMGAGVEVYYDRRWRCGLGLTRWVLENPDWAVGKRVLVLGAGLGVEAAALAALPAAEVWVNDLSPVAVSLCCAQVLANVPGAAVRKVCGYFEELGFGDGWEFGMPDCAVASFVVYSPETRRAMGKFLDRNRGMRVLLANEAMPDFGKLMAEVGRSYEVVWREEDEGGDCFFEIFSFDAE